jgi:hypothetical protein
MKATIPHTVIKNSNLFCENCGSEYKLKYPIEFELVTKKFNAFNTLHGDCVKTWKQAMPTNTQTTKEKGIFWLNNGDTGLSSKTMFNCFMGSKKDTYSVHHPHDPDDFSRCYKLLEMVPEWKEDIAKLKTLSKTWSNLADNWLKLTNMYEKNQAEEWQNYEQIGMYEFMQTLMEN